MEPCSLSCGAAQLAGQHEQPGGCSLLPLALPLPQGLEPAVVHLAAVALLGAVLDVALDRPQRGEDTAARHALVAMLGHWLPPGSGEDVLDRDAGSAAGQPIPLGGLGLV